MLEQLNGTKPTPTIVSRVFHKLVECLQRDLEACLTFYAFPRAHWKTIRTSNVVERLFEEVKKRNT